MWSVVISVTDGRERSRSRPWRPPFGIIRPKASRSAAVETSPPAPDSNAGGPANRLPAMGPKTPNSPVS